MGRGIRDAIGNPCGARTYQTRPGFLRGLLALITLAVLTVGLPLALYRLGGSPVPSRLASWHQVIVTLAHRDSGSLVIAAIRDISWLAWLGFALAVMAEAQAAIRGRRAPRLRLAGMQGAAGRLVASAALAFMPPAAVTLAASAAVAATARPATPVGRSAPLAAARADHPRAETARNPGGSSDERVIVVRPGDCLWAIAEHYLGSGDKYHEIVKLNLGREVGDGQVFSDPSLVEAGWRLLLPESGPAAHRAPGHDRDGDSQRGSEHEGHSSAHSGFRHPHPAAGHAPASGKSAGHAPAGHKPHPPGAPATRSDAAGGQPAGSGAAGNQSAGSGRGSGGAKAGQHDQATEAALFALGLLAGAVLASIDRLRHGQRQFRRPGRRIALPADPASRRIERRLRAAASRPFGRSRSADQVADDEPGRRPRPADWPLWPDPHEPGDQRGPAGNRIPAGGLEPFDPERALGFGGQHTDGEYFASGSDGEYFASGSDGEYFAGGYDVGNFDDTTEFSEVGQFASVARIPRAGRDWLAAVPLDAVGAPTSLREALRDLSEGIAAGGEPLPPIVGIHLTADTLDVLLSAPAAIPPPVPFSLAPARRATCWTVSLGEASPGAEPVPPVPGEVGDLLPGLFTAGATAAGGYLLLDLEAMRVTCCDGPGELTDRLLVTAATELASSQWSSWYDVLLVGCDELDVLGRAELCADLDQALESLESTARVIARRMDDGGPADVRTRRLADPGDEDWGLTILVSRVRPTPAQMSRLLDLADGPGGIAALVVGDTQTDDGKLAPAVFDLSPDPEHQGGIIARLTLAYLGPGHQMTVWPRTLTVAEYQALARVFATAADTADVAPDEPPYHDFGAPPWLRFAATPVAPADAATDDQALRAQRTGPRHAAPTLRVNVLGPVEIIGSAEPLLPKQAELVLALALHGSAGVSASGLCGLLGVDAGHPKTADSVRQLIASTRKRLGQTRDGQELIIALENGSYVPHADLTLDWTRFSALARSGRAGQAVDDLREAMTLVRGEPFADCYHWWIDIGLIETIRAEIVDTAESLAALELVAGKPRASARAARSGLAAESAAEQLWRAVMRAEHEAGNPAGVTAAWTDCLDAIAEIAPGGEPHPDTEQLYLRLTKGTPVGAHR